MSECTRYHAMKWADALIALCDDENVFCSCRSLSLLVCCMYLILYMDQPCYKCNTHIRGVRCQAVCTPHAVLAKGLISQNKWKNPYVSVPWVFKAIIFTACQHEEISLPSFWGTQWKKKDWPKSKHSFKNPQSKRFIERAGCEGEGSILTQWGCRPVQAQG